MATKAKKFIDVLTPGIVRLIAPNTKQREKSFFITPIEDAITREFVTGSEFDEAKEKEDGKNAKQIARLKAVQKTATQLFINDTEQGKKDNGGYATSESVPINHLMSFNKENDRDAAFLNLIGVSGIVAKDKKSFNGTEHFYYIEDANLEATELVEELDALGDALAKIKAIDARDYGTYIRYLIGSDTSGSTEAMRKKALLQYAQKSPADCLKKLQAPDIETRLLVHKMIENGIIIKDLYGKNYKKADTIIGFDFEEVLKFVLNEKNSQLIQTWSEELAEKTK